MGCWMLTEINFLLNESRSMDLELLNMGNALSQICYINGFSPEWFLVCIVTVSLINAVTNLSHKWFLSRMISGVHRNCLSLKWFVTNLLHKWFLSRMISDVHRNCFSWKYFVTNLPKVAAQWALSQDAQHAQLCSALRGFQIHLQLQRYKAFCKKTLIWRYEVCQEPRT